MVLLRLVLVAFGCQLFGFDYLAGPYGVDGWVVVVVIVVVVMVGEVEW